MNRREFLTVTAGAVAAAVLGVPAGETVVVWKPGELVAAGEGACTLVVEATVVECEGVGSWLGYTLQATFEDGKVWSVPLTKERAPDWEPLLLAAGFEPEVLSGAWGRPDDA